MAEHRVLYFVNYPFRMTGANQVLFNLLQSRKDRSAVIFMFTGPVVEHFRKNGIRVYDLQYQPRWIGSFGKKIFSIKWYQVFTGLLPELITLSSKLRRTIRSENLDHYRIIHFNDTRGLLTAGWFFRLSGYRIVTHIHGEFDANNVKGMRWRMAKFLSHRFITVSDYLRQRMDEGGRAKALNVYNGLADNTDVAAIPHLNRLRQQGVSILLKVASVVPFKGIHVLIEAARLLPAALRDKLLIVIAGPEPDEYLAYQLFLRAQLARYGLEDLFIFAGWQNNLNPFYNSCDVLVHSSMSTGHLSYDGEHIEIKGNEGLPTCILEAMRNAVPVIASRISGIPEQVQDRVNGLLVDPNDPQQLADAIVEWSGLPPEAHKKYRENSRQLFLSTFQLPRFVGSIENLYEQV